MATLPHLPIELHAEIRKGLHHYRDRATLLSAALVNKEWREGSQRILFSKMIDRLYHRLDRTRVRSTHMGFLQAIIEHPRRLGPLVHSYAQHGIGFDPAASKHPGHWESEASDLWLLMARALPTMINLKHLYLDPLDDSMPAADNWISSSALLKSFTFQLETFIWHCYYKPDHGLTEFLRAQVDLRHLESSFMQNDLTCQMLDDSICQSLISGSGCFNSLKHAAQSREIIAWKWYSSADEPSPQNFASDPSALSRLEYLCVDELKNASFRREIGPIDLNIVLLELGEDSWDLDTLKSLSNMPKLRVLVLLGNDYNSISSEGITPITPSCSEQLPKLQYIIHRYYRENYTGYCYYKFSLSPNLTEAALWEQVWIDDDLAAPWWTIYDI